MNLLISPNAFKGTLTALEASEIIQKSLKKHYPKANILSVPVADGGDGTCELLVASLDLERKSYWTLDPFGRPIPGSIGWDREERKAFLDVSTASGIGLLKSENLDPKIASTYGTGLLIKEAIDLGAKEAVLGLGGSATIDLGIGILAALGILFLDQNGRELTLCSPDFLSRIKHIQRSPKSVLPVQFTCLCDVKNPFFGEEGAIPVFGPQKGLAKQDFPDFEETCLALTHKLFDKSQRKFFDQPGFGAAGGIALGLSSFFDTKIAFGSEYFFEKINIEKAVKESDWVITGEGRYDHQSASGKACFELIQLAKKHQKKTVLITSGNPSELIDADRLILLPDLDFSQSDFREKAKNNLKSTLEEELISNPLA